MQTVCVGRATSGTPQHSSSLGKAAVRRQIRFRRKRGRQAKAVQHNRETSARRLPKRAIEQRKDSGVEENDRQRVAEGELAESEIADAADERGAPDEKSRSQDGPTLQQDPGPFSFREKEERLADEKASAAVCANAEAIAKHWRD